MGGSILGHLVALHHWSGFAIIILELAEAWRCAPDIYYYCIVGLKKPQSQNSQGPKASHPHMGEDFMLCSERVQAPEEMVSRLEDPTTK